MFIAAQLTIAKMWKQPKCPSIHEWISKLWYMYTMEYYSAIRNNDDTTSLWFSWREVEPIILIRKLINQENLRGEGISIVFTYIFTPSVVSPFDVSGS
uniref:Uncharacterized protein n=1 Tax=Prolemur simus TaxID=1328070 RepID=A0A8C9DNG3_PROSS